MAKFNQPILMQSTRLKKTGKMLFVDSILTDKFSVIVAAREAAFRHKDETQRGVMERIHLLKMNISK